MNGGAERTERGEGTPSATSPGAPAGVVYLDAHNHLQDEWLAPHLERVCRQLEALPIRRMVVNGTVDTDWPVVERLAAQFRWVMPSFGVHPWLVGNRGAGWREALEGFLDRHPEAGVGEVGLDRWILESARSDDLRLAGLRRAPLDEQRDVFLAQVELAARDNRPLTIHCLDAWGLLADLLHKSRLPERGFLLHAYGGSLEMTEAFAARGAYFSFSGYFLDERKRRQQEVFRRLPLNRVLVETDAPSMPLPPPWRTHKLPPTPAGQTVNHPANIEAVYAGLAALRGISMQELSAAVEANFGRFFGSSE